MAEEVTPEVIPAGMAVASIIAEALDALIDRLLATADLSVPISPRSASLTLAKFTPKVS